MYYNAFKNRKNRELMSAVYFHIFQADPTPAGLEQFEQICEDVVDIKKGYIPPGFKDYDSTSKFWKKNKKLIIPLIEEYAIKTEQPVFDMIVSWNGFPDDEVGTDFKIAEALFGKFQPERFGHLYHRFAIFALEEISFNPFVIFE